MNPYILVFGKKPGQMLARIPGSEDIIKNFLSANSNHIYMISGMRGSGKTIVMTQVSDYFRDIDGWEVVDLSPEMDLLDSLAAEMGQISEFKKLFIVEKLAISLPGFSLEAKKGDPPIKDAKTAVAKMLGVLKKHNKKVLVTIDEVISNASVKVFSSVFQILLRQDLPIYLIMSGLYENIYVLQNEKTLTFLYRAPRIYLKPIDMATIARTYSQTFNLNRQDAKEMAALTQGYPFAFQILGYFTWNNKGDFRSCIAEYKDYLADYAYDKIWTELSEKDRHFVIAIAKTGTGKTQDVKNTLGIKQSEYNPYRKRLINKGIIQANERGRVEFTLPFFGEYAIEREGWDL